MAVISPPEIDNQPVETSPKRFGGWFTRLRRRVKLALAGDDEKLVLENKTLASWHVYHNYHHLGIIDAREERTFKVSKHGSLSVCPSGGVKEIEYLVLPLTIRVQRVYIYRRQISNEIEVYDMRAA